MDLKTFLSKHKIKLPNQTLSLCNEGIERMKKGIDPLHDAEHVSRLLDNLDQLLNKETQIDKSKINFEVLLLSLCWHDVWEAERFPQKIIFILFNIISEGFGSTLIFAKRARELELSKDITKKVKYVIRKHSRIQILPIKTQEAQILKDIDVLDLWSLKRLNIMRKIHPPSTINPALLKFGKFYFKHSMIKESQKYIHFPWSKIECAKRQRIFFREIKKFMPKYAHKL